MNLPTELIRSINAGHAVALIGSGPSTEMGYPTWDGLATIIAEKLITDGKASDPDAYRASLLAKRYPELFRQIQFDCGGRGPLVDMFKTLLVAKVPTGKVYESLAQWRFSFYLTTNYDNEIYQHLERSGVHFSTLQNRLEDFHNIRAGATHLILKLHSDLNHPHEVVITSEDYKRLATDKAGEYFRTKLRSIFDMWDVVIVGHSFSDPDLQIILQTAQETANPFRPIYMIATGFNTIQVRAFYENYNIVIVPYGNPDGSHDQLRRLLVAAGGFVSPRSAKLDLPPPIDAQESEAAASMLIFRRLRAVQELPNWRTAEYLGPLILQAMMTKSSLTAVDDLLELKPFSSMVLTSGRDVLGASLNAAVQELETKGFVASTAPLQLSDEGRALAMDLRTTREFEKRQAYGQFATKLRAVYPQIDDGQSAKAQTLVEQCIVEAFRRRGLAIANSVFGDQSARAEDLTGLFAAISQAAAHLDPEELQLAFTEAAHEFLVAPTSPQRGYLTSLSQGFFLYHMLGYDAACARVRQNLFERTVWFCDSSVLIPLIAIESQNHDYAVDVFARLRSKNVTPFVTRKMCREVWQHLVWAVRFISENPTVTPVFIAAALVKPGYKENLFLDGFIRASAVGRVGTFAEYLGLCKLDVSYEAIEKRLVSENVMVTDMSSFEGFNQDDWAEAQKLADQIKDDRSLHSIYRSDEQVEAEAEVLFIIQRLRAGVYRLNVPGDTEKAYFISQSNVLNRVSKEGYVTTWTPEAVYRYVLSLPGETPDPMLLQECMLHEYYHAGISIVDKDRYLRFFGPAIATSRVVFEEQKTQYLNDVESAFAVKDLEHAFNTTPDLEKPLFVHRLTLRSVEVAQRLAREAIERAVHAERRVKVLEHDAATRSRNASRARVKQVAAEEKNRLDPKHVRKRERQRKRKKKKG